MRPPTATARLALFFSLLAFCGTLSHAQQTRIGVTWSIPDDEAAAISDLFAMWDAGITVVRTAPVTNTSLLVAADSLGIEFFQDLEVGPLPSSALVDSTDYALEALRNQFSTAERFRSARFIGLARLSDTSDPQACAYFRKLAEEIERSDVELFTYYTTPFLEADRCGEIVDGILLEARDISQSRLDAILAAAQGSMTRILGLASLGTWVDLELDKTGTLNAHSPEWQARFLEDRLTQVREQRGGSALSLVIVHRWRDPQAIDDTFRDLTQRRYGLLNGSGGPRPSYDVVRGFATGRQTVFARESGNTVEAPWTWMTIAGWLALALLGMVYASSPQMRNTIPRYFRAHGFYREAVASGRESMPAETVATLACVSIAVGMLATVFVHEISSRPVFVVVSSWLNPEVRDFVGALLDQPWTMVAVFASVYSLAAVIWTSVMSLISRAGRVLLPAQVLILIVWSQWPLLVFLVVSPAIAGLGPDLRLQVVALMVVLALLIGVVSTVRTTLDFVSISKPAVPWLVTGLVLHPLLIAILLAAVFGFGEYRGYVEYTLHLLARG
ncbi:MAG: hypothetical protein KJO98_05685 [Rhodothermia bacterium]|nr:hypothetical protein [Rhodothermia bacterium]